MAPNAQATAAALIAKIMQEMLGNKGRIESSLVRHNNTGKKQLKDWDIYTMRKQDHISYMSTEKHCAFPIPVHQPYRFTATANSLMAEMILP